MSPLSGHVIPLLLLLFVVLNLFLGCGAATTKHHTSSSHHPQEQLELHIHANCSADHSCTSQLNAHVSACIGRHVDGGGCKIIFGVGSFLLSPIHGQRVTTINTASNFQLSGQAVDRTKLVLMDIGFLFVVTNSKNVTFSDFSVTMSRQPFTAGKVTGVHKDGINLSIDTTMFPINTDAYPWLSRGQAIIGYNPTTERFQAPDIYSLADPFPLTYSSDGSNMTLHKPLAPHSYNNPKLGEMLVVRHQVYVFNGFTISDCEDVKVHRVTLYTVPGMGVYATKTRNIELFQFQTRRWRGGGIEAVNPMSITADGIHFTNMRGGSVNVIECILEGQGDDGLNVNTRFARVEKILSPTSFLAGQGTHGSAIGAAEGLWEGAILQLFDGRTMQPVGYSPPVASINTTDGAITLENAPTFDVPLYTLFVNANASAESTLVKDSTFLNNRARGTLLKQPNLLATGNTYSGMTSPAVLTQVDGCFWFEGRPLYNWTFTNNYVEDLGQFGLQAFVSVDGQVPIFNAKGEPTTTCRSLPSSNTFHDIKVFNNTVIMTPACPSPNPAAIAIYGSRSGSITSNLVLVQKRYSGAEFKGTNCAQFIVAGNNCVEDNQRQRCKVDGF